MIQRMLNRVTINVPEIDLNTVTNIEVTFDQRSSESEFTYSGENVVVAGEHTLVVTIPKEDAMQLDNKTIRGQVMYTVGADPFATKIFSTTVDELLKEDGYGD
jgi:hypothetical protein